MFDCFLKCPAWTRPAIAGLVALFIGISSAATASAKTVKVEFIAVETEVVIDNKGTTYKAWTFNGQFPGPVDRKSVV